MERETNESEGAVFMAAPLFLGKLYDADYQTDCRCSWARNGTRQSGVVRRAAVDAAGPAHLCAGGEARRTRGRERLFAVRRADAGQSAFRRSPVPALLRRDSGNAPARAAIAGFRRDR